MLTALQMGLDFRCLWPVQMTGGELLHPLSCFSAVDGCGRSRAGLKHLRGREHDGRGRRAGDRKEHQAHRHDASSSCFPTLLPRQQ